ncbi:MULTISPECIES: DUF624 domain-containing protein [Virgibacillus]|uniref:DUF624 domain-containing protein n=2 Tax=Virgibacillus TaxID=84406 RepID=A0ABQ2DM10_9BACI|nr:MULTISPECIES: DUF624 domain-containing protein [Virgibacillus]EQB37458.1 hypothetical protein M948_02630 [Virgibacillus sp. CM-4]MYL40209.1 DUF624 domain-containing protein [Virgibacillus massiliensis]GGJ60752.1 hypothetical protein GCM10007111_23640 [Virgibacillus kapii]CDQ39024.1 putative integral membrane protein [Virgibacillus massiliensis]
MRVILEKYTNILQQLYWFAYLQLLWVIFSVCGCIIFGIFPATYALFHIWKDFQSDTSTTKALFQQFHHVYMTSFFSLNKAGMLWQAMVLLISTNLVIIHPDYVLFKWMVLGMLGFLLLSVIHFFRQVDLNGQIIGQIKKSFMLVLLYPKNNAIYMIVFLGLILSLYVLPGVTFFFGVSLSIYLIVQFDRKTDCIF